MFALAVWDGRRAEALPCPRPVRHQAALPVSRGRRPGLRLRAARPSCGRLSPRPPGSIWWSSGTSSYRLPVALGSATGGREFAAAGDRARSRCGWWRTATHLLVTAGAGAKTQIDPGGLVERLRGVLEDAVERQLVADVPVGVFLSGGLDSSTLCALARRRVSGTLRTFSVGFEGPGAVSELPFAREVADVPRQRPPRADDGSGHRGPGPRGIVDGLDAPLADPTAIPTWYMSRLARERVTVALSGEGADEIFGGYARQRYDVALDRIGEWAGGCCRWRCGSPAKAITPLRDGCGWSRACTANSTGDGFFRTKRLDGLMVAPPVCERGRISGPYEELAQEMARPRPSDPVNSRLRRTARCSCRRPPAQGRPHVDGALPRGSGAVPRQRGGRSGPGPARGASSRACGGTRSCSARRRLVCCRARSRAESEDSRSRSGPGCADRCDRLCSIGCRRDTIANRASAASRGVAASSMHISRGTVISASTLDAHGALPLAGNGRAADENRPALPPRLASGTHRRRAQPGSAGEWVADAGTKSR